MRVSLTKSFITEGKPKEFQRQLAQGTEEETEVHSEAQSHDVSCPESQAK